MAPALAGVAVVGAPPPAYTTPCIHLHNTPTHTIVHIWTLHPPHSLRTYICIIAGSSYLPLPLPPSYAPPSCEDTRKGCLEAALLGAVGCGQGSMFSGSESQADVYKVYLLNRGCGISEKGGTG